MAVGKKTAAAMESEKRPDEGTAGKRKLEEHLDGDNAPQQQQAKKKRKKKKSKVAELKETAQKYERGEKVNFKAIDDKKLKGQMKHNEKQFKQAATTAALTEQWLLPSEAGYVAAEGMEETWRFQQDEIVKALDINAAKKAFDLQLTELGPYRVDFTHNGRYLALAGRKGHLALMDWARARLITEVQVKETTRDIKFLHNDNFFAAAQKKYVYIYDKRGLEVHCLKEHTEVARLEFLRHHFLLASVGAPGVVRWQDTTTGMLVAQHRTKLGRCQVMRANEYNAVLALGHSNGSVTMWSPNMSTPLVQMLCHKGPLLGVAFDTQGRHMVTSGMDGQVKVWDARMFQPLHAYYSVRPASSIDISQRGVLAVGYGPRVQLWKDALSSKASAPYLNHIGPGTLLEDLAFCPYDDVLMTGHSQGVTSLVVPGSGEPNFDSYVANPYETRKQKRQAEVTNLLDKLPAEMITLHPENVGGILRRPKEERIARQKEEEARAIEAKVEAGLASAMKHKMKVGGASLGWQG
eukprot:jgi/Mesvir1/1301/Mv03765-RA.3